VDLRRVALSHLDHVLTPEALDYHKSLVERGAYIVYDDFGEEYYLHQWSRPGRLSTAVLPRDIERVEAISKLIDKGCLDRIMLSSDICEKIQLEYYGGFGYHHILRDIVPMLKAKGVSQKEINTMLVENPRRFLAF
jgi:phosphotriesterase-related protein